jgi:Alpha/beta hydrolase family
MSPIKTFLTNKYIRIFGILALISGVIFVIWALIPSTANILNLDKIRTNPNFELIQNDNYLILRKKNALNTTGLIFYPGAKVDSWAYLNTLEPLVNQDKLTLFITKPPLHYAFFQPNGAKQVEVENKEIKTWIIGGHSLGGVFACDYFKKNSNISSLILIGSYCTNEAGIDSRPSLSISGTQDGLIQTEKSQKNVFQNTQFIKIEGMNHAQAGDYGDQLGDKQATISNDDAKAQIVVAIREFLK